MTTPKVKYITDFFYDYDIEEDYFGEQFFHVKIQALLNCLSEKEIKLLFKSELSTQSRFAFTILNFIIKSGSSEKYGLESTIANLLKIYPSNEYKTQLYHRTILTIAIKNCNRELILEYFNLFVNSNRINERKKAFEIADLIWDDVGDAVWETYFKHQDAKALNQIINNSTPED